MGSRMKSDKFSLCRYKKVLQKAKGLGYKFLKVSDYKTHIDKPSRLFFMRHDVDISPINALKMAEAEQSLGIKATYYVRVHSIFYNPAAPPFYDALKKILDMGNEIGVHYDCTFFEKRNMDIADGIRQEAKILESIFGVKIKNIAQHKPTMTGLFTALPKEYINAYDEKLMKKCKYISESGFKWWDETLSQAVGKYPKIYLLTHPDTWVHADLAMTVSYAKTSKEIQDLVECHVSDFARATNYYLRRRQVK